MMYSKSAGLTSDIQRRDGQKDLTKEKEAELNITFSSLGGHLSHSHLESFHPNLQEYLITQSSNFR